MGTLEWGTVPDWFIVVVTAGGFGATVGTIIRQSRRQREEREREKIEQLEERHREARRYVEFIAADTKWADHDWAEVTVTNGSTTPMFNSYVKVLTIEDEESTPQESIEEYLGVLHPGTIKFRQPLRMDRHTIDATKIWFQDPEGRRWVRSSDGELKETD